MTEPTNPPSPAPTVAPASAQASSVATGAAQVPATQQPPKGFLEEEGGRKSAMRAMSFISLVAAIAFGVITILTDAANQNSGVIITFGFLLGAFAPKALQKFAESKVPGG